MIKLLISILMTGLLAGCLVCTPAENYTWTLKAPSAVVHAPHSRLHFTVQTSTPDGRNVEGVPFIWSVDWAGLRGVEHEGHSFRDQGILVKGEPGTAVLRIFASDRYARLMEVARANVQVRWPQP